MKSIPKRWFFAASRRSRAIGLFTGLILVALIGVLDYFTGYELAFSPFYLIPILIASWFAGWRAGLLIALLWPGSARIFSRGMPIPARSSSSGTPCCGC